MLDHAKNKLLIDVVVFASHILLWTAWTLCIRFARDENGFYPFEFQTAVLLTEVTKFILSLTFHFGSFPVREIPKEVKNFIAWWPSGIYFIVPAFIYLVYNMLLYYNLSYFDPVSYRVLINNRILWSGLLFQVFFRKQLGLQKWLGLAILLISCVVNQLQPGSLSNFAVNLWFLATITIQGFTSSLGGVYSELLLKKDSDIPIHVKNAYLYFFSIIFTFVILVSTRPDVIFEWPSIFFNGYSTSTWVIIFLGAFCGFSTSFFLKYLNVLLKEFAHSGEMFATALGYFFLFNQTISVNVLISLLLCVFAVLIYSGTLKLPTFFSTAEKPPPVKSLEDGATS